MTVWRVVWLIIFIAGGSVEVAALINDAPNDTLSEQVWALLEFAPWLGIIIAGALVWLIDHFLRGGKR